GKNAIDYLAPLDDHRACELCSRRNSERALGSLSPDQRTGRMGAMLPAIRGLRARDLIASQVEFGECRDCPVESGMRGIHPGIKVTDAHPIAVYVRLPEPLHRELTYAPGHPFRRTHDLGGHGPYQPELGRMEHIRDARVNRQCRGAGLVDVSEGEAKV